MFCRRYCFCLIYVLVQSCSVLAQNAGTKIDSLLKVLPNTKGLQRATTLSELSFEYVLISEIEKSKVYAQEELELGQKLNNSKSIASGYNDLAIAYWASGNLKFSLDYNLKALAIREKLNDSGLIAYPISKIANIYISNKPSMFPLLTSN